MLDVAILRVYTAAAESIKQLHFISLKKRQILRIFVITDFVSRRKILVETTWTLERRLLVGDAHTLRILCP
jgi:hypothetical protein